MHEDNAYDDEDLYTEDGDFKPDFWPDDEDLEDYDHDLVFDDEELNYTDEEDLDDDQESPESLAYFDMVQDDEGNWVYPEDLEEQRRELRELRELQW